MLDVLWKRHSQAGLQMLFHNTSPLGGQSQPRIFSQRFLSEAQAQGHLRSIMSAVLSESRASSLAKGFESTAPAWLAQAQPCVSLPSVSSVSILPIRGSKFIFPPWLAQAQPCVSLPSSVPIRVIRGSELSLFARLWFQK